MKKIKKFALIALLSTTLIPSISFANSHDDWRFSFKMGRTDFTEYTSSRLKKDTSPIYCNVTSLYTNGQSFKIAAVRGDKSESTYTDVHYFSKPGVRKIKSNIMEDSRSRRTSRYARLRIQKYGTFDTGSISGLWSPDSY